MSLRTVTLNWGFVLFAGLSVVACVYFGVSVWVPVLCFVSGVKVQTTHHLR
mgnify:CR=1 FL=1